MKPTLKKGDACYLDGEPAKVVSATSGKPVRITVKQTDTEDKLRVSYEWQGAYWLADKTAVKLETVAEFERRTAWRRLMDAFDAVRCGFSYGSHDATALTGAAEMLEAMAAQAKERNAK
jgi:hypothetical protein